MMIVPLFFENVILNSSLFGYLFCKRLLGARTLLRIAIEATMLKAFDQCRKKFAKLYLEFA
jgi:hypothetical protein